ncbi:hypothetical protein LG314_03130 [Agrococcus terreus]|uniref:hypothetical protein n=1 Tax=Agrococcus terreus TaxID=574649 RepID=UPI00384C873C
MAKQQTFIQRLKGFWRDLTGSGVRTYEDPNTAGGNDERNHQAGADTGMRNQMRSFGGS